MISFIVPLSRFFLQTLHQKHLMYNFNDVGELDIQMDKSEFNLSS